MPSNWKADDTERKCVLLSCSVLSSLPTSLQPLALPNWGMTLPSAKALHHLVSLTSKAPSRRPSGSLPTCPRSTEVCSWLAIINYSTSALGKFAYSCIFCLVCASFLDLHILEPRQHNYCAHQLCWPNSGQSLAYVTLTKKVFWGL